MPFFPLPIAVGKKKIKEQAKPKYRRQSSDCKIKKKLAISFITLVS